MGDKLIVLYQEMADLTRPKCGACKAPHSCCSPEYCDFADAFSTQSGNPVLERREQPLKFLREDGTCSVPPHLRPMCTLHVCSINSLGFDQDAEFTKKYYDLRDQIELEEAAEFEAFPTNPKFSAL